MYYNWSVNLVNFALGGYLFSGLLYLVVSWYNRNSLIRLAYWLVALSFVLHTTALISRALAAGRLPFAGMNEFLLLFAWGVVLVYLFIQARFNITLLGLVALPLVVALLTYASALDRGIHPLVPALQSFWLELHVMVAVLAYGAFGVSFGAAVLYLIRLKTGDKAAYLPSAKILESVLYRSISFGFPFMTLVLITGAVWAEQVWGRWWSWDPKETWALVTWIIYAIYLHARFTRGWQGRIAAWMAITGFAAVLFTLFGVTTLMSGLHSY